MEELAGSLYNAVDTITGPKIKYHYTLVHFNINHPVRNDTTFTGMLEQLKANNVYIPKVPSCADLGSTVIISNARSTS